MIKFIKGLYSIKNIKDSFKSDPVGTSMIVLIFHILPALLIWAFLWNNFILPSIK
jgi:hypothetical protein